jgi:hypothetical protein
MNSMKLTPAAVRWLEEAAAFGPVWPTFGPYTQLVNAGLIAGPQERATVTEAGRRYLIEKGKS